MTMDHQDWADTPLEDKIRKHIRDVQNFPREGKLFKDIGPILVNGPLFGDVVSHMAGIAARRNVNVITASKTQGFILGAAIASTMKVPFAPLYSTVKWPHDTVTPGKPKNRRWSEPDRRELHVPATADIKDKNVCIVDDILATGGTMAEAIHVIKKNGGNPSVLTLAEIIGLHGRTALTLLGIPNIDSIVKI